MGRQRQQCRRQQQLQQDGGGGVALSSCGEMQGSRRVSQACASRRPRTSPHTWPIHRPGAPGGNLPCCARLCCRTRRRRRPTSSYWSWRTSGRSRRRSRRSGSSHPSSSSSLTAAATRQLRWLPTREGRRAASPVVPRSVLLSPDSCFAASYFQLSLE